MPITVLSPYSGRAVKARDQDIGRALRDEEGRIFYIVERPDGGGHYAAPTRKGSDKDLERYDALETKGEVARQTHHEQSAQQVHDARGQGRKTGGARKVLALLIVLAALAAGGYFLADALGLIDTASDTPSPLPGSTPTQPVVPATPAEPAEPPAEPGARLEPEIPQPLAQPIEALALEPSLPSETSQLGGVGYVPAGPPPISAIGEGWHELASGLSYRVEEPGYGERARAGQFVTVEYEVRLATGTVIDSSRANGPMRFVLWSGQAMQAWDEAVAGMKRGERREVVIPPALIECDTISDKPAGVDGLRLHATVELLSVQRGVEIEVIDAGEISNRLVMPGDRVELDYTGMVDGAAGPFASSAMLGEPLRFVVGSGEVVPGLDLGVAGMTVGETRRVKIPPYLAYGRRGVGRLIPAEATLLYDVTLRQVTDAR